MNTKKILKDRKHFSILLGLIYTFFIILAGCSSQEFNFHYDKAELPEPKKPETIQPSRQKFYSIEIKNFDIMEENKKITAAEPIGGNDSILAKTTYPEIAKRAVMEGIVVLSLEIDENGLPQNIIIQRGIGALYDDTAIQSIKGSRFIPAKRDNKPVATKYLVCFNLNYCAKWKSCLT